MAQDGWRAKIIVYILQIIIFLCDIILLPFYFFMDKPWNTWKLKRTVWAQLEDVGDPYGCYQRLISHPVESQYQTMDELFHNSVAEFGSRKCCGTRQVLGEEEEISKSGKILKKLQLGEYKWLTYNEVNIRVNNLSRGLLSLGVQSKKPIVLLAETRVEWFLTAQACFRINVPIVTLYANLRDDGLVHGINETEITHIVTSYDLLLKLKSILHRIPGVTHILYMEGMKGKKDLRSEFPENVQIIPYNEVEEIGCNSLDTNFTPPQPDDMAILMYTSGSTGVPKGVMITQKNIVFTVTHWSNVLNRNTLTFGESDSYIAYLPAAHILELAAECYLTSMGVKIAYSSPQTLTDYSPAVKTGAKGDFKIIQPTLLVAVPLMLDRIRKAILQLAGPEGSFSRLLFDSALSYKKHWSEKGFQTPLLDKFCLKRYREFLGGAVRLVLSGSAPLSPDTQTFIRDCLSVRVLQGYALTETSASATVMDYNDLSIGRVGAPLSSCKFRLVDWKEGHYSVKDRPNPRGEIVIGGDCLTLGYFKNPVLTQEAFKFEGGNRWFYTGDIGEVFPDGTVKIIDRKKDLVKLQFGEYVALGKIEGELKTFPLIENICVVGNSFQSYLVAVVVANPGHLKGIASSLGKEHLTFEQMCTDQEITDHVTQRIRQFGTKCGLFGSEIPRQIKLCSDEWTPESGLVTAAWKIRRKCIEEHYKLDIDAMYMKNNNVA